MSSEHPESKELIQRRDQIWIYIVPKLYLHLLFNNNNNNNHFYLAALQQSLQYNVLQSKNVTIYLAHSRIR